MVASNSVLVPLQAEFFALEGLSQLLLTVRDIRSKINEDLKIHGIVLTMFDKRNNLSEQIEEDVRGNLGELVYDTVIPRNVRISEAPSFSMPALIYDHKCSGAIAYQKLAAEFLKREDHFERRKNEFKNERKKGLGRGLSSFLDVDGFDEIVEISNPEDGVSKASNSSNFLPIEQLVPNQNQPRKDFSADELKSLASSIRETGIIQPILVRKNNSFYEIVAGERRWRAAQLAKIHEVPVLIKELTNEEVVKISIVENIQRVDLNPIEEANSYHQLIRDFGYTQEKVSSSLGKSRSYIANSLRLLSLPESIIKLLKEGKLTSGHARALVGVKNSEFLAKKIIEDGLSVRDIENIVKKGIDQSNNRIEKKPSIKKDVDTLNLEQDLKMALGLKTVIDHNENSGRGSIIIKYRDLEQLDEFCSKIMKI